MKHYESERDNARGLGQLALSQLFCGLSVLSFQSLKVSLQSILGSIVRKFLEISDQSSEIPDCLRQSRDLIEISVIGQIMAQFCFQHSGWVLACYLTLKLTVINWIRCKQI